MWTGGGSCRLWINAEEPEIPPSGDFVYSLLAELPAGPVRSASSSGALLEELDALGCRSIFASHLHGLLTLDLGTPNMKFIKMETTVMDNQSAWSSVPLETMRDCNVPLRKPTWRVVEGKCVESLALTVALEKGVKAETVKRASELLSM